MADQKFDKVVIIHDVELTEDEQKLLKTIFRDVEHVNYVLDENDSIATRLQCVKSGGLVTVNVSVKTVKNWFANQVKTLKALQKVQPPPMVVFRHRQHVGIPKARKDEIKESTGAISVFKDFPQTSQLRLFVEGISNDCIDSSIVSDGWFKSKFISLLKCLSSQ